MFCFSLYAETSGVSCFPTVMEREYNNPENVGYAVGYIYIFGSLNSKLLSLQWCLPSACCSYKNEFCRTVHDVDLKTRFLISSSRFWVYTHFDLDWVTKSAISIVSFTDLLCKWLFTVIIRLFLVHKYPIIQIYYILWVCSSLTSRRQWRYCKWYPSVLRVEGQDSKRRIIMYNLLFVGFWWPRCTFVFSFSHK